MEVQRKKGGKNFFNRTGILVVGLMVLVVAVAGCASSGPNKAVVEYKLSKIGKIPPPENKKDIQESINSKTDWKNSNENYLTVSSSIVHLEELRMHSDVYSDEPGYLVRVLEGNYHSKYVEWKISNGSILCRMVEKPPNREDPETKLNWSVTIPCRNRNWTDMDLGKPNTDVPIAYPPERNWTDNLGKPKNTREFPSPQLWVQENGEIFWLVNTGGTSNNNPNIAYQ